MKGAFKVNKKSFLKSFQIPKIVSDLGVRFKAKWIFWKLKTSLEAPFSQESILNFYGTFFFVFTNKFYKVRLKSQSTWHQHQQWQRKCYEVYKDDIEVKDEKLVFQKNADLHKPVLNKIMITHDQCGKYNFVAHLNNFSKVQINLLKITTTYQVESGFLFCRFFCFLCINTLKKLLKNYPFPTVSPIICTW